MSVMKAWYLLWLLVIRQAHCCPPERGLQEMLPFNSDVENEAL